MRAVYCTHSIQRQHIAHFNSLRISHTIFLFTNSIVVQISFEFYSIHNFHVHTIDCAMNVCDGILEEILSRENLPTRESRVLTVSICYILYCVYDTLDWRSVCSMHILRTQNQFQLSISFCFHFSRLIVALFLCTSAKLYWKRLSLSNNELEAAEERKHSKNEQRQKTITLNTKKSARELNNRIWMKLNEQMNEPERERERGESEEGGCWSWFARWKPIKVL